MSIKDVPKLRALCWISIGGHIFTLALVVPTNGQHADYAQQEMRNLVLQNEYIVKQNNISNENVAKELKELRSIKGEIMESAFKQKKRPKVH